MAKRARKIPTRRVSKAVIAVATPSADRPTVTIETLRDGPPKISVKSPHANLKIAGDRAEEELKRRQASIDKWWSGREAVRKMLADQRILARQKARDDATAIERMKQPRPEEGGK